MHKEKCALSIMQNASISLVYYTAKQLWKAYAAVWKNVILYIVKTEKQKLQELRPTATMVFLSKQFYRSHPHTTNSGHGNDRR